MPSIVFFGTSEFAVPSLEALAYDPRFHILAVVTQPDRPVGRHATVTPPAIKVTAQKHGLRVLQPEKVKGLPDLAPELFGPNASKKIDAFVVVSYGKILPQWLIDIPRHGAINVHGSLLPRWRGASPIHAAIASGDKMTGVTVMKLDAEMDHGPILATEQEVILDTDTGNVLHDRLALIGGEILPETLVRYLDGKLIPREQDHSLATSCKILSREDGKIDWTKTSQQIERLVRAYTPWPGTWTEHDGKRLKILAVRVAQTDPSKKPGQFFMHNNKPFVACSNGTTVELLTVQPDGKKPMNGEEYAKGNL